MKILLGYSNRKYVRLEWSAVWPSAQDVHQLRKLADAMIADVFHAWAEYCNPIFAVHYKRELRSLDIPTQLA